MSSLLLRSASQVLKNPEISRAKKIKLRIHALSFGCTTTQTCFHQVLLGIHLSHKRSDKVTIIPRPLPSSTIVKATDHDHEKKRRIILQLEVGFDFATVTAWHFFLSLHTGTTICKKEKVAFQFLVEGCLEV